MTVNLRSFGCGQTNIYIFIYLADFLLMLCPLKKLESVSLFESKCMDLGDDGNFIFCVPFCRLVWTTEDWEIFVKQPPMWKDRTGIHDREQQKGMYNFLNRNQHYLHLRLWKKTFFFFFSKRIIALYLKAEKKEKNMDMQQRGMELQVQKKN